jgi:fatty acid desaturase
MVLYQGILDAFWFLKRFGGAEEKVKVQSENKLFVYGFYVTVFTLLTVFNAWGYYLLFWVVPYLTSFFMFQYIRSVAEHFGELAYEDELSSSRTVMPSLLERFLIAPHHVGYHLEHHLYPGVPYYHLPQLHKLLMRQEKYKLKAHITTGYMSGLLRELGEAA